MTLSQQFQSAVAYGLSMGWVRMPRPKPEPVRDLAAMEAVYKWRRKNVAKGLTQAGTKRIGRWPKKGK